MCKIGLMCSDPIKAYLLDGECVKDWAHNALDREQSHLLQVCLPAAGAALILGVALPTPVEIWPVYIPVVSGCVQKLVAHQLLLTSQSWRAYDSGWYNCQK